MDTAFAWIGQLAEWLGKWIPQVVLVKATHGGVKFVGGKKVVEMKPGLHVYWPIMTGYDVIPVVRQTHNLWTQVMLTKDQKPVVVGLVVTYTIYDVVKAIGRNWDVSDTINDVTQTAALVVITQWNLDDLISKINVEVRKQLTAETRRQLRRYGVSVQKCALTDFSTCRVLKLVNDNGAALPGIGK